MFWDVHSKKCWVVSKWLGQIWTNPNVGLKMKFKILTQFQLSLSTVIFLNYIFNPTFGFVHI